MYVPKPSFGDACNFVLVLLLCGIATVVFLMFRKQCDTFTVVPVGNVSPAFTCPAFPSQVSINIGDKVTNTLVSMSEKMARISDDVNKMRLAQDKQSESMAAADKSSSAA